MREERYKHDFKNPSFSSSLLDEIYRSIDGVGDNTKHEDLKFYRETTTRKQNKGSSVKSSSREIEVGERMSALQRACLIEKWMEQKVSQKVADQQRRQSLAVFERNSQLDHHDQDQDVLFFSSTSSSSDSSSSGFSSSDAESIYGARSRASSYNPPRPKPVRTSVSARSRKTEETERTLFYEQRELHVFDDYHYNSATEPTPRLDESIIKSKSRALKIYSNLKKVKQPISPGGKVANFINSLFTTGNTKKSKKSSSSSSIIGNFDEERKLKSGQASTCSSASSFSRSCLSKHSPSTRERLRNGVKRNVRFYPVSVIVDEDCRPCGHKSLYEEEESSLMAVSLPTAWKIGKSPSRKIDDELKYQVMEKSRRVEEVAKKLLKDYHQSNDIVMVDVRGSKRYEYEDGDEDNDDAASYSSSDLFELDHLSAIGNDRTRFCEELPVYETTHVGTNRAIANGLIV